MSSSFPSTKVYITKNSPDGKATFLDDAEAPTQPLGPLSQLSYIYSTPPILSMDGDADLDHHAATSKAQPMVLFPAHGGTASVMIDFAPNPEGEGGFMHKTKTLDYVVILEGELELELLGGEKRNLKKGEVVIQRECFHSWKNVSKTEGARMLGISVGGEGAKGGEMEFPPRSEE